MPCAVPAVCVFLQDTEFTVQDGKLFMLQTRNGKRTGPAALKIAIDLEAEVGRAF
jgi:pyruvate,orthophosphate dikinase